MYVSHNEPQICHLNTNYSANTIVSTTSHQATLAHNYFTKPRRRVALDRWGERYKTSVEKKKGDRGRNTEEVVHRVVPMGRSRGLYTIGSGIGYVRVWIAHDGSP